MIDTLSDHTNTLHYLAEDFPVCIEDNRLSVCRAWKDSGHWHKGFQLLTVLSGEMDCRINENTLRVRQGQGIFINDNRLHFFFPVGSTDCIFNCIVVDPCLLGDMQTPTGRYALQLAAGNQADCLLLDSQIDSQHQALLLLLCQMRQHGLHQEPLYELALQSLWGQAIQILYHILPPAQNDLRRQQEFAMIRSMTAYVQNHYFQHISIKDIAEAGLTCRSKCTRLFREHLYTTPNVYLLRCRLLHASTMLLHTDLPITEIAMSCGFGSSSYFAEMFRREFNQTPTEMRRNSLLSSHS